MADERVSILLELRRRGARVARDLRTQLGRLGRTVRSLGRRLVVMGAAAAGAAFAFSRLVRRGGEVINTQRAFERVSGSGTQALERLRRVTRGLITDLDLMSQFNRSVTLGSARNVKQFSELAKTAITLGRALRVNAGFALESLSLGIGRQSRLILDNLGIIVSVEQANRRYADALGVTTSELTEAQKREAFRTAALEAARQKIAELGGIELNAADQLKRFGVVVVNFTNQIAAMAAQSPAVAEFFAGLADIGDDIGTILEGNQQQVERAFELLGEIAGTSFLIAFKRVIQGVPDVAGKAFEGLAGFLERTLAGAARLVGGEELARVVRGEPVGLGAGAVAAQRGPLTLEERRNRAIQELRNMRRLLEALVGAPRGVRAIAAGRALAPRLPPEVAGIPRALGLAPRGVVPVGGPPTPRLAENLAEQVRLNEVMGRWADLQGMARQIIEDTLTPQERYDRQLANIRLLHQTGHLNAEQYRRAIEQLDSSMQTASVTAEQLAVATIQAFASITQAIVGGRGAGGIFGGIIGAIGGVVGIANPLAGAALGALGGIITGLSSRQNDRPRVVVDEYGSRALGQLERVRGPDSFTLQLIQDGVTIEEIEYQLARRGRLGSVARFPAGRTVRRS